MARKYDPDALAASFARVPGLAEAASRLPQLSVISQEALSWHITGLERFHGEQAVWHLERAAGFGSSDIGAILRTFNSRYSHEVGFNDGYKVIEQKQCKRLPDYQNEHMERGTVLEDLAARVFKAKTGVVTDQAALDLLAQTKPMPSHPWLKGNPDDIVMAGSMRILADYKVPNSIEYLENPSDGVEFDYKCQVHHLSASAKAAGIPIHNMMVVKLDLAPEVARSLVDRYPSMEEQQKQQLVDSIVKLDIPGFGLQICPVPHDQQLMNDILNTGNAIWDQYVLTGQVPNAKEKATHVLTDEELDALIQRQHAYGMAKSMVSDLNKLADAAGKEISEILKLKQINPETIDWPSNLVSIRQKKLDSKTLVQMAQQYGASDDDISTEKYSEKLLLDEIERLGGDTDSPALKEMVTDPAKAEYFLAEIGVETMSDEVALRVSSAKKNKAYLEELTRGAHETFQASLSELPVTQQEKKSPKGPSMG